MIDPVPQASHATNRVLVAVNARALAAFLRPRRGLQGQAGRQMSELNQHSPECARGQRRGPLASRLAGTRLGQTFWRIYHVPNNHTLSTRQR